VTLRLGKLPPRVDPRTLQMAKYLVSSGGPLPAPPARRTWSQAASPAWGMMKNDELGDCTCAAAGHAIQVFSANAEAEITPTDDQILAAYEGACGYVPGQPDTDRGGVELDVLSYWQKTGIAGVQIEAFAACEPGNHTHVKAAIDLFGGCYIGLALPASAQRQVGSVWSVVAGPSAEPGSWGGHAVFVPDYDRHGLTCITWGQPQRMTWGFWRKYTDEAYALLCPDLWAPNGVAPSGFDIAALRADLALVAG
jgi:hypothetical protein